jgi:hypothetical protein
MRSNLICVAGCKASYYTCAFFRISLHLFIAPISPHQTLHTYTVVVKSVDIIFSDFGFRFRFFLRIFLFPETEILVKIVGSFSLAISFASSKWTSTSSGF